VRTVQNAVLSALQRAQRFILEYTTLLTSAVDFTAARKRLDDIVASFTTHAVDQSAYDRDTKGETAKQQQLRLTLRTDVMRPIAEIARRNLRTTPEFKALQMPRQRVGGPSFVASAKAMAEAATIHKATLIERGLPADFLDQFQTAVAEFDASVSNRENSRTRRIGATKGLVFQQQEGRSVLKVLDALVGRALRGNEALLAAWKGARTIHRRPGGAPTSSSSTTVAAPAETQASTSPAPTATAA